MLELDEDIFGSTCILYQFLIQLNLSQPILCPLKLWKLKQNLEEYQIDSSSQWQVENNAIDGGILHVKVVSGGGGYTHNASGYTSVAILGDGSSGACTVHTKSDGTISHVTVTANGSNYKKVQLILTVSQVLVLRQQVQW